MVVTVEALAFALAGRRDGPEDAPSRLAQAEVALAACSAASWRVLLGDALPRMPAAVRPPRVLFVRGAVEALAGSRPSVAVVGSRAAPEEARRWAEACARALVSRGACVVSGLAHGIDAAAHRAALDAKRVTMLAGVTYKAFDDKGLHIEVAGKERCLPVDNVVLCAGQLPLQCVVCVCVCVALRCGLLAHSRAKTAVRLPLSFSLCRDVVDELKTQKKTVHIIGGAFKAAELDAKAAINQAVRLACTV